MRAGNGARMTFGLADPAIAVRVSLRAARAKSRPSLRNSGCVACVTQHGTQSRGRAFTKALQAA